MQACHWFLGPAPAKALTIADVGLDLWFQEDVARILASTRETMDALVDAMALQGSDAALAYRRGFSDALRAVGVAFGMRSPRARWESVPGEQYRPRALEHPRDLEGWK